MFEVEIYKDVKGNSAIIDLLSTLNEKSKTSKDSRIRLNKIREYIQILKEYGTRAGEPYIKHISNTDLWELRPTRDRVFFAHVKGDSFLLLHHFMKKTQKTPKREIDKALRNLADYNVRG